LGDQKGAKKLGVRKRFLKKAHWQTGGGIRVNE